MICRRSKAIYRLTFINGAPLFASEQSAQRSGLHGQCSLLRAIGRSDQRRHAFAGVRTWTETKAIADVRR